jgi:hypothetical protein
VDWKDLFPGQEEKEIDNSELNYSITEKETVLSAYLSDKHFTNVEQLLSHLENFESLQESSCCFSLS